MTEMWHEINSNILFSSGTTGQLDVPIVEENKFSVILIWLI